MLSAEVTIRLAQPGHRRAQPGGPVNLAAALRRHGRDPR